MEEQLILFETAKLAKESNFDWKTPSFFENTGPMSGNILYKEYEHQNYNNYDFKFHEDSVCYSAPTQTLLQKWLREKHNIQVYVYSTTQDIDTNTGKFKEWKNWKCRIITPQQEIDKGITHFSCFEDAMEVGLYVALQQLPQA